MSLLPPWLGVLLAWLLLGALAAGVLWRGLKPQATALDPDAPSTASTAPTAEPDVQTQAQRRIQQEHLADLTHALNEGRLSDRQYAAARDEVMRQVLSEQPREQPVGWPASHDKTGRVRWGAWVVGLCVLSGIISAQQIVSKKQSVE